ncbi:MAG: M42 family peptidase [Oscillospiraceae bacterium]|nr:M42 family peptidase [Oscillospiraceae bacterium]
MNEMNSIGEINQISEMKTFVIYDVLKKLTDAVGVSGNESSGAGSISNVALELLKEYAPDATLDCHGSVTGILGGNASIDKSKPTIMLDAHIDQIGLIVIYKESDETTNNNGFVKAEPCGGIDRRCLAGQRVTVHTKTGAVGGIVCTLPPHVMAGKANNSIKADEIWLDVGDDKSQIALGDVVTIDGELTPLLTKQSKTVSAPALDDRAGVCAILHALYLLKRVLDKGNQGDSLPWNVAVSFSVQEEIGCRGAEVTAYNLEPDYAIVVDVSYGLSPGCPEHKCGKLGGGVMVGYAPSLNRTMFEMLKNTALDKNIPHQLEIMSRDTGGTNADSISTVKGGVKTALLSIPLRYMHTPVETLDLSDVEATGKLIAEFISGVGGANSA